jgi:hypothetical protein
MRIFMSGVAAAFAFFFMSAAPAAAESIECPLSQARRTITTDLPSGWWTTPIVNSLSETRVQTIGGNPALVCVYGPAGSIQRNAPDNHDCTARTGGFECTPRIRLLPIPIPLPTTPAVHRGGSVLLAQTYLLDLDTGAVGGAGDLWFQAATATEFYLTPRNGAQMAVGDRSERGYAGCSAETFSTNRVALSAVPAGSWVCMRTNEGRISQFRVNLIVPGSPRRLNIAYTTWE